MSLSELIVVSSDAALILGVVLCVSAPRMVGLAVVLAALVVGGGDGLLTQGAPASAYGPLVVIVLLAAAGLGVSWWTGRLRIRLSYLPTPVMWGALIGSFIGLYLLAGYPALGMILGLIVGTMVMELRSGRDFGASLRQGLASLIAMLGEQGFQLLIALLIVDLGLRFLPL